MKKSLMFLLSMLLVVSVLPLSIAPIENCALSASLVSQDPYPALPGESVKLVFQVEGVENPSCGKVDFTLIESFPIKLETGTDPTTSVNSGVFVRNSENFFLATYDVIIDPDAIDGDHEIEASINSAISEKIEDFMVNVEDSRADFEVSVKDYVSSTRELTFEILNIAESDVESLTIEIEKQDNIVVKGSNRNIVGSLDSNEDTTFSFEATPNDGDIKLMIYYTDTTGERRNIEKMVQYDSTYFTDRVRDQNGGNSTFIWVIAVVVLVIVWWIWRRSRKKKHHAHHRKHGHH